MAVSSSLLRVPVEMPDRSGHNLSHSNLFTGKTGTLIPVMCEELLPNDTVSVGANFQVQLPPMVTDFYGKVDFVLEAFFVPNRLCWRGWKDFITRPNSYPQYPEGIPVEASPTKVPTIGSTGSTEDISPTSNPLMHYLDYGKKLYAVNQDNNPSVLPLIAYHRIWDDWYRDSRVQTPAFYPATLSDNGTNAAALPYVSTYSDEDAEIQFVSGNALGDGVGLTQLRQRNWVKDYFTSASPLPQAGSSSEVSFDVVNSTGAFSISTLRAANSMQRWMERNSLAGYRYADQIYAQFGRYPADAIMDRCLYLGRHSDPVYNRSVFDTSGSSESSALGTKAANSQVLGEGSLVDNFTASEHGFLMVLASLVPRPIYGSGAERRNYRKKVGDFAFPLLAGMGDQPIHGYELNGDPTALDTFGYTDLYAEYKFRNDKIHGLMRDGLSLDSYALQRSFDQSDPRISSSFLQIPTEYLDQVQAVETSTQGYTYWAEVYFPYKKISTIPAYSQPTLADLKHSHTEYISRGGKRL